VFLNCPVQGTAYPELLTTTARPTGAYQVIRGPLAMKDLLNPRRKRFEVEVGGTLHEDYADTTTTTTVGWNIRLERVKPRK
jgi:hypothetical protein